MSFEDGAVMLPKKMYSILSLEMIAGLETRLFEGEDGKGKMPKYSFNDLDKGLFRCVSDITIFQLHDSAYTCTVVIL